jgi:chromate transporter
MPGRWICGNNGWPSAPLPLKEAMPPDSSSAATTAPDISHSPPSLVTLFIAFAKMSLAGFGGVLVWARRGIVDQHKWMTADEFNETFALCHFLPGPNIVNLTFVFGSRLRGIPGAIAAFSGLVGPPALIMVVMGMLYHRYGEIDALRRILSGVACAAIGLMLAVVFRMMTPLLKRRDVIALLVMVAVFIAIGIVRLPLAAVLLMAIPISIGITWWTRKEAA